MNNDLRIFENEEFGKIRTLIINNEPWFVGKDVAEILGYSNSRDALVKHVDNEDKGVAKCDTLGGTQELTVINESGLYSMILSSKLPTAKRFKHWVTSEVLPSIRKYGIYELKQKRRKPVDIIFKQNMNIAKNILENMEIKKEKAFIIAIERTEELTGEDLTAFKKLILTTKNRTGYLSISMLSDIMGLPIKDTNNLLENCKFQYRNEKKQWKLTEEGQNYGKEISFNRNGRNCCQIRWNEHILDFIDDKIMD